MFKPEEILVEDVEVDKTENLELPSLHDPIIQTFPVWQPQYSRESCYTYGC
jgi:hypothetical protein